MSNPTQADRELQHELWRLSLGWASREEMTLLITRHRLAARKQALEEAAEVVAEFADDWPEDWGVNRFLQLAAHFRAMIEEK